MFLIIVLFVIDDYCLIREAIDHDDVALMIDFFI